jgi:hypothetical protein
MVGSTEPIEQPDIPVRVVRKSSRNEGIAIAAGD